VTPEGKIKAKVDALLKQYGAYYFKPVQNGMGAPGLDYHCVLRGHAFFIETKAPGKHMTPRQRQTTQRIGAAGGVVWEVNSDAAIAALEAWLIVVKNFKDNPNEQINVGYRDPFHP
jgi:hypothetical protein